MGGRQLFVSSVSLRESFHVSESVKVVLFIFAQRSSRDSGTRRGSAECSGMSWIKNDSINESFASRRLASTIVFADATCVCGVTVGGAAGVARCSPLLTSVTTGHETKLCSLSASKSMRLCPFPKPDMWSFDTQLVFCCRIRTQETRMNHPSY